MKTNLAEKIFRILFVFIFVLGTVWVPGTSAKADESNRGLPSELNTAAVSPNLDFIGFGYRLANELGLALKYGLASLERQLYSLMNYAQIYNPYFEVRDDGDSISGWDWQPNTGISISVDGVSVATAQTDEGGYFGISVGGTIDLVPGNNVEVTDSVSAKAHIVTPLSIASVDVDADIVSGTATPNSRIKVWACGPDGCVDRWEMADGAGNWSANFSISGDEGGEEQTFNIVPGTGLDSGEWDEDGDYTIAGFHVPNPHIVIFPEAQWFEGSEWPDGATVTISVDGKPGCATAKESWEGFFNGGFGANCNVVIGDMLTFSDGTTTRTHTVQNLVITEVDKDANTLAGTADIGATVYATVWGFIDTEVTVEDGSWLFDFGVLGIDLVEGMSGRTAIRDEAGNETAVDWYIPNPRFTIFPEWEWFDGLDWPDGATVTITVGGKPECQLTKESWGGFFNGNFPEGCDVAIGDTVTFADGTTTRTHTVRNLAITAVDAEADTVAGTADEGAIVNVWPHATGEQLQVTADSAGTWQADFNGTFDLVPGEGGRSEIRDGVGNATAVDWYIPNPRFEVRDDGDSINGWDWQPNTEISISVDGVTRATAQTDEGGYFGISVGGTIDLVPGNNVEVTDGVSTKAHIVTPLSITGVNVDTDIVSGTATPNSRIKVWACGPDGCIDRWETVDGAGNWSADFSIPGDEGGEEQTFDIVPGTGLDSREWDEDGDNTVAGYSVPNPYFEVSYDDDYISGWEWQPNMGVNISVDGVSLATAQTEESGYFDIDITEMIDLVPGSAVEVTDGVSTKVHIITPLSIVSVDVDTDIVSGTATSNGQIKVWACGPDGCIDRWEIVNGAGNWLADFSVPGDETGEEQTVNIVPGTGGASGEWDEDGDNTVVGYYVPNPHFVVFPEWEWFDGLEWPDGATVTITVGGKPQCEVTKVSWGSFFNGNFPEGCDVAIGDTVTFTDGTITRTHTVRNLGITEVDQENDTISGTADAGVDVFVWPHATGEQLQVTADSAGTWQADFTGRFDLVPGEGGRSEIHDDVGNATAVDWYIPKPRFEVRDDGDSVNGWEWQPNTGISISVDGISLTTVQTDEGGNFYISVSDLVDLIPGSNVEVTDGVSTKAHIVTNLSITNVDVDTDIVSGTATPNSRIQVWTCWPDNCANRWEMVNGAGNWSADFSIPGDEEGEEQTFDIVLGTGLDSQEWDEDGDTTAAGFNVPNPSFSARFPENEVHGYGWPLGASVTLTIADPNMPQPVDYTDTETVVVADWDPNQTFVVFRLWENGFSLEPGMTVSMSDGQVTKSHVVSLTVTAVDPVADTVSGTAAPGSLVEVGHIYCDETGCYGFRRVIADGNGDWVADFSQVGEDEDEQDIIDILPGTGSEARQPDEDGDTTNVQWRAPNPFVEASPNSNWAHAREWPLGTEVTLTIDGAGGPYTTTAIMQHAPWNPGDPNDIVADFDLQGYDIQAGDSLTATVGAESKTLIVSQLQVTSFDLANDTLSGRATPGVEVQVCANIPGNCISRYVMADASGDWMADYSGEFNLQSGSNGWAAEREQDGDQTWYDWNVPNPTLGVRANTDAVEGWEWILGSTITVTVDDPGTAPSPDVTKMAVVYEAPWNPGEYRFDVDLNGEFDIQPGNIVTASDGVTTKTHTVTGHVFTDIDINADTVTGTAEAGSRVDVWACDASSCINRHVNANSSGIWLADFAQPGAEPDEQSIFDITYGTWVDSSQSDEDGDVTMFGQNVPNPTLGVRANTDAVEGWEWPLGATITVTVDDPGTVPSPDVTRTAVVYEAPWNPGEHRFDVDLNGEFDIQPGDIVTASDGVRTKTHTVTAHVFTDIDIDTDTVTGTAQGGSRVDVWACDASSCINRHVDTDGSGVWSADFAHHGDEGDEQNTFDITYGTWVDSSQPDQDGDVTMFGQNVPNPTLTVNIVGNGSVTLDPPGGTYEVGTVVTLTAIPDPDWGFAGWSGDVTGTDNPVTVTMDADKSVTATFTPSLNLIFADSFESGNFSNWSACITDVNDLSVSAGAKSIGNYGMQALLDDNAAIYCTSDHPNAETRYLASFYFDPNTITMASGDTHTIFGGYAGASTLVLRMQFRRSSNTYQVRVSLLNDGTTWRDSSWFTISDAPHQFEFDWRAASAAGANDGGLTLWIDGGQLADLTAVDNDTRRIYRARLGAVAAIDTGTRGTYYFDEFESSREGGGPAPTATLTVNKTGTGSGTVTSNPAGINCGSTCSSVFNTNTVVTLTATANSGSTFTGWSGGGCSGTGACVVTLMADTSVTANFDVQASSNTLTVSKTGTGSGTVTSSPAGIDCGLDCSESYTSGTVVTLTATAASGSTFTGWSDGGCSGTGTCTVTLTADTSVTANFDGTTPPDIIFADGFESGNLSQWSACVTDVNDLSVSAAAKSIGNYGMQALLDDNAAIYCTSDHPTAETRYRARFSFDPNSIAMASGDAHFIFNGFMGSSTAVLRVEFRYFSGAYQVRARLLNDGSTWTNTNWFTISDAAHSIELDWRASTAVGANNGGLTLGIDSGQLADLTVVDNDTRRIDRARLGAVAGIDTGTRGTYYFDEFESSREGGGPAPTATLTVTKTGTGGGTVTSNPAGINCGADCSEAYPSNTSVTLTATATAGSTFTGWSGGGCSGTGTCMVNLTADTSVTANFDLETSPTFTLTVSKTGTGSGTVTSSPSGINCGSTCSFSFNTNTQVTLTATPAPGSTFTGWSGSGCSGTGTCMVTMTADTSVTANFELSSPTDTIFADGFETGNLSNWSACTTDVNDLSVSTAAKSIGNYGMQALLDDNAAIYCTSDHPTAETRYRARFSFDPNSIAMASGDAHFIFNGFMGSSTAVLRVEFRYFSGAYQVRARLLNDGSTWTNANWFTISDAAHFFELDWRASTAVGANNGGLTFWIDGVQLADLSGIDNDTRRIDRARLGAVAGIDTGTRGAYYFDAFESRRQTYIGP